MKNVLLKWKDSKFLFNNLKNIEGLKIIGVTDRVTEKELDESIKAAGINEICDTLHAANLYLNGKCDAIIVSARLFIRTLEEIANEFIDFGVKESDIVIASDEFFEEPDEKWLISWNKYYRLPYLEYHVADHCNLNCSSCVHFSPLVKEPTFTDFDKLECDLMQLKRKVHYFDAIRILGGEPLLNDRLSD
ncbi:MAG: hypothetical protein IKW81_09780, partial [Pseudobutyrivibrio sp.]|nr:hypothetical protein [Pseudobutyrivibrio sp.]